MELNSTKQNLSNSEVSIQENKSKKTVFVFSFFVLLTILILGSLCYQIFVSYKSAVKIPVEKSATNLSEQVLSPEQQIMQNNAVNTSKDLGALMSLSPITFPKVVSQETLTSTSSSAVLVKQFADLILLDAKNLEVQNVKLDNGQSGTKLIYEVSRGIANINPALPLEINGSATNISPRAGEWKKLISVYSEFAGVTVLENTIYQAEILETYLSGNSTNVIVLVIKK